MTKDDKKMLDEIFNNKERYTIKVDNDVVWVIDKNKDPDDDCWTGFDEYGYEFIISLFEYLGFKSEGV